MTDHRLLTPDELAAIRDYITGWEPARDRRFLEAARTLLDHADAQDAELARLREALTNLCDAVTETREKLLADVLAAARQGMDALNGRPLGSVKVVGPEGAEVESVRDDGNKANCDWTNLLACCQRCHLHIQGRWQPGGVLPPEWGVPEWVTERGLAYRQVVQHALFEEG